MRKITLFITGLFLWANLHAVEYFLSLDGNDSNPGTSENTAFKSIKKAVDVLKPGDILTILPGEYLQQTLVKCSGTPDKPIVIRGTDKKFCILKGWKDIGGKDFKAVPGTRFVYSVELQDNVYNVIESDSEQMLDPAPGTEDMDYFRSSYYYDKSAKKLYVHSSDGKSPEAHSFKATVIPGHLLKPEKVQNMIIENLSFCGAYAEDSRLAGNGYAIRTYQCGNMLIRNCEFHYNCGGYSDSFGLKNTIQNCRLSNNLALGYGELGQIMFSMKSADCTALDNIVTDGVNHGLRFYSGATDVRAIGNIVINDNIGLYYKATAGKRLAERNVVDKCKVFNYSDLSGGRPITDLWNTFSLPSYIFDANATNLVFNPAKDDPKFCDTESLDYRLQSDSPYRKKGPDGKDAGAYQFEANVFFVSPDGNDGNDGLSVKSAFLTLARAAKELKAGATLYLLPGVYKESLTVNAKGTPEKPVTIRSRGKSPDAQVASLIIENSENINVEKLSAGGVSVKNSQNVKLERIYSAKETEILSSRNVRLGYSTMLSGLKIEKSPGIELHHSILSSDKNYLIVSSESTLFSEYNNFISPESKFAVFDKSELNSLDAMKKHIRGMRYCVSSPDCFKFVGGKPYLSPFSVCSGMDGKGMAIGAFEVCRDIYPAEITDVKINYLTPSSASISWTLPNTSNVLWRIRDGWTDGRAVLSWVKYGTTPACEKKIVSLGDIFNNVTIDGLEAGKKYYFKIEIPKLPGVWLPDTNLPPFKMPEKFLKTWKSAETEVSSFNTPEKFEKPRCRTLYLSPKGSDGNNGLSRESAWKTLEKASLEVRPGDTVVLCDGVYQGTFRPVVSGLSDFKITLKAENCNSAVIDGTNFTRPCGIFLDLCNHVVIDGIVFENFSAKLFGNRAGMDYGQLEAIRSGDITVRNCVFNTRGQYQPCTVLKDVFDVKFVNNVFTHSPGHIQGWHIRNIEFNGNTFYYTSIRNFSILKFTQNSEIIIKNNLFAGLSKQKVMAHEVGINGEWTDLFKDVQNKNIKFVCDYNAWYFSPSDPYHFCGFEDFPSDAGLPLGIKRLQEKFGIEKHSIEVKDLSFKSGIPVDYMNDEFSKLFEGFYKKNKLTLKAFELPENSPLSNSGENGVRIGAGPPDKK